MHTSSTVTQFLCEFDRPQVLQRVSVHWIFSHVAEACCNTLGFLRTIMSPADRKKLKIQMCHTQLVIYARFLSVFYLTNFKAPCKPTACHFLLSYHEHSVRVRRRQAACVSTVLPHFSYSKNAPWGILFYTYILDQLLIVTILNARGHISCKTSRWGVPTY